MKQQLEQLLQQALAALSVDVVPAEARGTTVEIERTRDPAHGDFASNLAMRLAKAARRNPRQLAQSLVAALPASALVAEITIAGAGFINFRLAPEAYRDELLRVIDRGDAYGRSTALGAGRKILLEFVSANPTGPLHVGHGRHAAYGAALANLLEATGHRVHREYYLNDAGRQMDIFATSVWLRYLEACGEPVTFPSNAYRGEYVREIAAALRSLRGEAYRVPAVTVFANLPADGPEGDVDKYIDAVIARARAVLGAERFDAVFDHGLAGMTESIRADLAEFGVTFDRWYSERSLFVDGSVDAAIADLRARDKVYEKDGALWFRTTDYGDKKDRVIVRENGQKTYFAPDIAYHLNKWKRGFEQLIDVWGADHHGYIARVKGSLAALGAPGDILEVQLMQLVALYKSGVQVSMGKRSGDFVTLRELREEVGNDACRFFYVLRSNDQPLDFDMELARAQTSDNPVYYIQYAHARVASVRRQLTEKGYAFDAAAARASLDRLVEAHETALLTSMSRFGEVLQHAALNRAPHSLAHYLRELANDFHTYYNAHQFIVADEPLRNARLLLIEGLQQVIRNGLRILGVSAPDSM